MKKLQTCLLLFIIIAAGCKKDTPAPVAAFDIDASYPNTVSFINRSQNATSYKWDFGDGVTSTETSPTHNYQPGKNYIVTLTAMSPGGTSSVSEKLPFGIDFSIDLTQSQYSVLDNTGGQMVIDGVLVAKSVTGYVALSALCTYDNCTLQYAASTDDAVCPCCQSRFHSDGTVEFGPAAVALTRYATQLNGNILRVFMP